MFRHILIPTDFAENSKNALDIAVKLKGEEADNLTVLHVIEMLEDAGYDEFEDFYEELRKRSQKKLDAMVQGYRDQKVHLSTQIVYGKRSLEIVRFAEEHGVDLIVIGSHSIDRNQLPQNWGTISYKVGILANCPVLMVK